MHSQSSNSPINQQFNFSVPNGQATIHPAVLNNNILPAPSHNSFYMNNHIMNSHPVATQVPTHPLLPIPSMVSENLSAATSSVQYVQNNNHHHNSSNVESHLSSNNNVANNSYSIHATAAKDQQPPLLMYPPCSMSVVPHQYHHPAPYHPTMVAAYQNHNVTPMNFINLPPTQNHPPFAPALLHCPLPAMPPPPHRTTSKKKKSSPSKVHNNNNNNSVESPAGTVVVNGGLLLSRPPPKILSKKGKGDDSTRKLHTGGHFTSQPPPTLLQNGYLPPVNLLQTPPPSILKNMRPPLLCNPPPLPTSRTSQIGVYLPTTSVVYTANHGHMKIQAAEDTVSSQTLMNGTQIPSSEEEISLKRMKILKRRESNNLQFESLEQLENPSTTNDDVDVNESSEQLRSCVLVETKSSQEAEKQIRRPPVSVKICKNRGPKQKQNNNNNNNNNTGANSKTKKHHKSLEQRQMEYALARMRIFGEGSDVVQQQRGLGGTLSGGVFVTRQPTGPDGTPGFTGATEGQQGLTEINALGGRDGTLDSKATEGLTEGDALGGPGVSPGFEMRQGLTEENFSECVDGTPGFKATGGQQGLMDEEHSDGPDGTNTTLGFKATEGLVKGEPGIE